MFKANKIQKNFFAVAKLLLFIGVLILLYFQVKQFSSRDWDYFHVNQPVLLVLAIALVVPNIWCAYRMWSLSLKLINQQEDRSKRVQSFFAGLITGMLTPNMIGNFIGRLYYYEKEERITITGLTLLSNYAQFITSFVFGFIALFLIEKDFFQGEGNTVALISLFLLAFALIIYFRGEWLIKTKNALWGLSELRSVLEGDSLFRLRILGLSISRFLIFTSQFFLILLAFDPEVNINLIPAIWLIYLLTMLAPSLFLGKLGIKESIALFVLADLGVNDFAVLFGSLIIWFVNSLTPALGGLFICKKRKFE